MSNWQVDKDLRAETIELINELSTSELTRVLATIYEIRKLNNIGDYLTNLHNAVNNIEKKLTPTKPIKLICEDLEKSRNND